ncbi:MAG TPA: CoA transferase [Burkholderiaceae bacterium]|nr:CoA transferase [Burkholderiaceae bacterium]
MTEPIPYRPDAACPLDGIRVLDLSRVVAGNMLSLLLADFGAEVIKIEAPGRGDSLREWNEDGIGVYWKVYARNKKSLTLDIRKPRGKEILQRLVAGSDVLIENFRPGVLERLGFSAEALHAINDKLVIVRLSGWGQTGPYSQRPGFGSLVEAISGFAAKNGFADKPPALPNLALADMVSGLHGAYATMIALREVETKQRRGQVIDLSLLEPMIAILGPDVAAYRVTGQVPPRSGNRASISAPRNVYLTRDGHYVALSASTQEMTERLFRVIGRPELIDDPRFRTNSDRLRNVEELDGIVGDFIGARDCADALAFFEQAEVTVGPVYDVSQIMDDRHIRERGVYVELPDPEMGRVPMHDVVPRLSDSPGAIRRPAPALGEHNDELLRSIGICADEQDHLRQQGVI